MILDNLIFEKKIKVYAFFGPSVTGKSYRAQMVASERNIDFIIDDGLLINENEVVAGTSAKKAPTKIETVKAALFTKPEQKAEIVKALRQYKPNSILILGTSDNMVKKIAENLGLPEISEIIYIDEVATEEEMETARRIRTTEGKHVIPVPTFEIKKDFSGFLLDPLQIFKSKGSGNKPYISEKSIIRPTFSYLGNFKISDTVFRQIAEHMALKTDAIYREENMDRYDDRDDIKTNLLESYERLVSFIAKHLNDKFYLENNQRINVRDIIARELCVNLLIHREYSNPLPARLIITKDAIITENANKPKNIGYIDLYNYTPYPKNPKLANFFKEIGLADELGSGIKKITKYNKIYTGGIPSFKDDDVFKVIVPLETNKVSLEQEHNLHLDENKEKLYNFIKENGIVTRKEINNFLAPVLKVNNSKDLNNKIRYMLAYLRKNNLIENIGTDKKSQWVIK